MSTIRCRSSSSGKSPSRCGRAGRAWNEYMIADCRLRIAGWQRRAAGWRLWGAVAALAFAATIALTAGPIEPAAVRLLGVSAEGSAVLIEASEPVAYVVSRPDQMTVIVELRDATIGDA